MERIHRKHIWLMSLVAMLFFVVGCGTPGLASSPVPVSQTLQNSAKAMSQLKSVHLDLQATLNIQAHTSSTNTNPVGMTFNVTGHGDVAMPNQLALNLFLGQNRLFNVISTGKTVYIQGKNGQWYSIDISGNERRIFSQGLPGSISTIVTELKSAKLTDHGQESVNGETLDHITATLDAQTLQALSSQLNGLFPAKQQSGLNALKQGALDLWIDQSTSYIHQATLHVAAQIDLSTLSRLSGINAPSTVLPLDLKIQVNFSKFNQPVNIQTPSGAIPFPNSGK